MTLAFIPTYTNDFFPIAPALCFMWISSFLSAWDNIDSANMGFFLLCEMMIFDIDVNLTSHTHIMTEISTKKKRFNATPVNNFFKA